MHLLLNSWKDKKKNMGRLYTWNTNLAPNWNNLRKNKIKGWNQWLLPK